MEIYHHGTFHSKALFNFKSCMSSTSKFQNSTSKFKNSNSKLRVWNQNSIFPQHPLPVKPHFGWKNKPGVSLRVYVGQPDNRWIWPVLSKCQWNLKCSSEWATSAKCFCCRIKCTARRVTGWPSALAQPCQPSHHNLILPAVAAFRTNLLTPVLAARSRTPTATGRRWADCWATWSAGTLAMATPQTRTSVWPRSAKSSRWKSSSLSRTRSGSICLPPRTTRSSKLFAVRKSQVGRYWK